LFAVEVALGFGFSQAAPPSVTSLPKKSRHRSVLFSAPEAFSRVVRRRPSGLGFCCRVLLALVSAPLPRFSVCLDVPLGFSLDRFRPQARRPSCCFSRTARRRRLFFLQRSPAGAPCEGLSLSESLPRHRCFDFSLPCLGSWGVRSRTTCRLSRSFLPTSFARRRAVRVPASLGELTAAVRSPLTSFFLVCRP
jgi:hypothetical protein